MRYTAHMRREVSADRAQETPHRIRSQEGVSMAEQVVRRRCSTVAKDGVTRSRDFSWDASSSDIADGVTHIVAVLQQELQDTAKVEISTRYIQGGVGITVKSLGERAVLREAAE